MIKKTDISIIIPTLNDPRNNYALGECLTSLKESGFPMENVIIAYNGTDGEKIESPPCCQAIFIPDQGQCKAVNTAAKKVETKWIMVTNDDMIYPPHWLKDLTFSDEYLVGVISPQLIEPRDGAPTFKKYFCGGVGGDWNKRKFLEYAKNLHIGEGIRPGFNLPFLLRMSDWDLVEGYDENYDPWGSNSDSDLEYKFKLAGIPMLQNTYCTVYHFSNTSDTFHPRNRNYWQQNWDYFVEKWGFERVDSPEIWTTEFEIPYDKLKYRPEWAVLPEVEAF